MKFSTPARIAQPATAVLTLTGCVVAPVGMEPAYGGPGYGGHKVTVGPSCRAGRSLYGPYLCHARTRLCMAVPWRYGWGWHHGPGWHRGWR